MIYILFQIVTCSTLFSIRTFLLKVSEEKIQVKKKKEEKGIQIFSHNLEYIN